MELAAVLEENLLKDDCLHPTNQRSHNKSCEEASPRFVGAKEGFAIKELFAEVHGFSAAENHWRCVGAVSWENEP